LRELVPVELAKVLREKGFYVSRHANWLIVMKGGKMASLVYVYPLYEEAEVVDLGAGEEVAETLKELAPSFRVNVRRAKHEHS